MSFNMSPPGKSFVSFSSSFSGGFISDGFTIAPPFITADPGNTFCPGVISFLSSGFFLSKKASGFIVVFFALNVGSAAFLDFLTFTTSCDKIAERSSPPPLV